MGGKDKFQDKKNCQNILNKTLNLFKTVYIILLNSNRNKKRPVKQIFFIRTMRAICDVGIILICTRLVNSLIE